MTVLVRPATPDDVPAAADVLADAFADYPWTRWTVDADDHGERLRALHRLYLSAVALPFGPVDVGETPERLVSVAVWVPSTAVPEDVWTRVGPAAAELAGDRATAGHEAEATLAGHRLEEPHVALAGLVIAPVLRPVRGARRAPAGRSCCSAPPWSWPRRAPAPAPGGTAGR